MAFSTKIRVKQFDSACIKSATYDEGREVLTITFTSGKSYEYYDVPAAVYEGLVAAPSAGQYFNKVIRAYSVNYRTIK